VANSLARNSIGALFPENVFLRVSGNTRRTEFGRCGKSSFRQASECLVATRCAFDDFVGDVLTNFVFLGPGCKNLACSFEGDFHVG
jgi:hypothetical protein